MKDFEVVYADGEAVVNWSASVTGIDNIKQKLVNNLMTDAGTDEVVPTRGTDLLRSVTGGGVYDLRTAQHALNFAALAAKRTVRGAESEDAGPSDKVADFTAVLASVEGRVIITDLSVKALDGRSIGALQQII